LLSSDNCPHYEGQIIRGLRGLPTPKKPAFSCAISHGVRRCSIKWGILESNWRAHVRSAPIKVPPALVKQFFSPILCAAVIVELLLAPYTAGLTCFEEQPVRPKMEHDTPQDSNAGSDPARRRFLSASSLAMAAGLAGGYGTFAFMLGRFVYPARASNRGWLFVCQVDQLAPGAAMDFATPSGQRIVIARQGDGTTAEDFLALSSVCPHLGCRVHWESNNDRFFCPCHNGAFDRQGNATAGPPLAAHQRLTRFPLKVENGLLFLEAPLASLTAHCQGPNGNSLSTHSSSPTGVA